VPSWRRISSLEALELEQWPAAGGSKKSLVVLRIMASYTIDQLRGTLAAA